MKIRIGFALGTRGLRDDSVFRGIVDDLERLHFDSLWLSERITSPSLDPVTGMAFAAGHTRKLKFGTNVLVLPGRNPAQLAKQLASLDRLSEGRLLLSFGLGVVEPFEQQAFGVERKERAPWFNEALPLLRRFWSEDCVDHEGPRFAYHGLNVQPKPIQHPLEVWLGGIAPSELRRTGRFGDGWLPSQCTPADAEAGRKVIEQVAAEHDREIDDEHFGATFIYARGEIPDWQLKASAARRPDLDPRELIPIGLDATRAQIKRFIDVGVSKFVIRPVDEPASWHDELEEVATEILPLQT